MLGGTSPYHHGASRLHGALPPVLPEAQARADIVACARVRPAVGSCKPTWLAALDSLASRGADPSWIAEARSHIEHGSFLSAFGSLPKENLSAYSLRRGLATQASRSGSSEGEVSKALRHKNVDTTRRYIADLESRDHRLQFSKRAMNFSL